MLQLVVLSATWENIPEDIRTACQKFDLDPVTTTYTACPACSFLYSAIEKDGYQIYPARCDFKCYPSSCPCSACLTKFGVKSGITIWVPVRPFILQSFTDFIGKLYWHPGIEEMIRQTKQHIIESDDVWDINQASAICQFQGDNGKIFVDCKDELRTVWSFSYDAFNPYHNKAAGKSASVRSIAMKCISLPSKNDPKIYSLQVQCWDPNNQVLMGSIHSLLPWLIYLTIVTTKGPGFPECMNIQKVNVHKRQLSQV